MSQTIYNYHKELILEEKLDNLDFAEPTMETRLIQLKTNEQFHTSAANFALSATTAYPRGVFDGQED
jgi:hypothetical protein